MQVDTPSRESGRLKRKWTEVVRIDLKKCNPSEDLAKHRLERQKRIQVADPRIVGSLGLGFDDDDDFQKKKNEAAH